MDDIGDDFSDIQNLFNPKVQTYEEPTATDNYSQTDEDINKRLTMVERNLHVIMTTIKQIQVYQSLPNFFSVL